MLLVISFGARLDFRSLPAREYAARESNKKLASAVKRYHADCGEWSQGENGTETLFHVPHPMISGWKGPYIQKESELYDAWGNGIQVIITNGVLCIISSGEDMVFNTEDDLKMEL